MEQKYLAINLGSQSKKYALANGTEIVAREHLEPGVALSDQEFNAGLELVLSRWLEKGLLKYKTEISRVGIRIVAPGTYFTTHRPIEAEYREKLINAAESWPLHLKSVIAELSVLTNLLPSAQIWGISDSAFHQPLPERAKIFPINQELAAKLDLYRFGYHGLSISSIVRQLEKRSDGLPDRVLVAHLGGGVSVTALKRGKTIETSMGFTPLGGVLMSTRIGEMDPGALIYLAQNSGLSLADLLIELESRSGLFALSGNTGEVRDLLAQESNNERARLALEIFISSVLKYLGGYATLLGGVDLLVLTGTIAERSETVRSRIKVGIQHLLNKDEQIIVLANDELWEIIKTINDETNEA